MKLNSPGFFIIVLLTSLLALGDNMVNAQFPDLKFKHLNVDDGLSQSTVSCIFQDKMGFMWFGTDIGINKYDGNKFTYYRHDATDTTGIPSNFIVSIYEDSYGFFWIGTGYSGLSRLDREKDIFYRYISKPGDQHSLSNDNVRAIFEDSRKNLWIGTSGGGLNLFDRKNESFVHFNHDSLCKDDIGSNYITGIAEDRKGFLWLGSSEGTLTRFDPETHKGTCYELYDRNLTDKMTANFGLVYIDSQDDVWYCTENGLYWFNKESSEFNHFVKGNGQGNLNENAVTDIEEIGKGFYLVATDHGGINIFNKNTGTFSYHLHSNYEPLSISNNQIYTIFRSRDGIIWIGNYNGGINIFDPRAKKFMQHSDLPVSGNSVFSNGSVLSICEDENGNIWFGYDGQGINIYNPKNLTIKHLEASGNPNSLRSNIIVEIFKSRNEDIWIGTYLKGMSKIDAKTGRYTHFIHNSENTSGLGGNNVWSILEDKAGFMWIGLVGNGLDRYDPIAAKFYHYTFNAADSTSLCNNNVYKIFEDKSGNIWVGTRNGLGLYNPAKDNFINYISGKDIKNGIHGNYIYDIYQDNDGNLWVGTDQALNLYNYADSTFEQYSPEQGLAGNSVLSISGDNKGNLWLSTNRGISRFNKEGKKFRNYDMADGLLSNEFNLSSSFKGSAGHIFFGSKSGFNFFHPDSIFDNPLIPPIYITSLEIQNEMVRPVNHPEILSQHINYTRKIVLDYKQTVFTLGFAALNYSNSEKNQYAYMLEGFDKDWNNAGDNHDVTYTNLDPGHYTFKVKGSNSDGLWNNEGASLEITILPPWWKTLWFRIIIYSLAMALVILLYYLRLTLFERQKKKLMLLVHDRTLQLEEVAVSLEEKQEEINSQNEKLMMQRDELESNNRMLTGQKQQIMEQNRELDLHRNQLESLVEERTRELIEAKDKAEESDRLKSSFLANLSHEIRTPLNAILGFSSLLGEKNLNTQEREEYNRIIHSSSNNLLELINDILDISKIEAGQLELDMNEVSLEAVVNDLADIFELFMKRQDLGSNKQVELRVCMDETIQSAKIITDSLRLNQILANLINNAIKFTRKGFIEVGCSKLSGSETLEFYVKDTGIGIRAEHQQLVFERFRKVEDDKIQLHRGTGLGLAITSQLVSLLGGSMRLVSEYGKGSVFYFTIPLITAASSTYKVQPRKAVTELVPDFCRQVILVAEDDISNFNYVDKLLRKANARVLHAEDGSQVLRMLEKHDDIAAVLMDIKMPVMDGIEALHALRKSGITIPVIAQTAYALADEVVKLKKEGFDEYISKPIQRQTLYSILQKFLIPSATATDQSL